MEVLDCIRVVDVRGGGMLDGSCDGGAMCGGNETADSGRKTCTS